MSRKTAVRIGLPMLILCLSGVGVWYALPFLKGWYPDDYRNMLEPKDRELPIKSGEPTAQAEQLEHRFAKQVKPVLASYCYGCHGAKKPKAGLDLSQDATVAAVVKNAR